jgi:uncharacterized phage protein (TIGR01671 family)
MFNPKFRLWNKVKKDWEVKDFHLIGETVLLQGFPLGMLNDLEINQFTGLKDKNGVEIYEEDIVSPIFINSSITAGTVIFDDGSFLVKQIGAEGYTDLLSDSIRSDIEVIGNIYENPELMENIDD